MNILLIGAGAREHALGWKIKQSPNCDQLFFAPGNAGTNEIGINLLIGVNQFEKIEVAIQELDIQMLIVGPEDPLVNGITDYLREKLPSLLIVGPDKNGAQLEGSKDFSKSFMQAFGIPTAAYKTFTEDTLESAIEFLHTLNPPYVLKADGLAAGKGVIILDKIDEAITELKALLGGKFSSASKKVVIEEYLDGVEASVFVATDGKSYKILPVAKDHKRIGDNDTGPNTGGMGSISPVPFADDEFIHKVEEQIIRPTLRGIQHHQMDYRGFIFIGLMCVKGNPYVIEYNCRMGDPETETVMLRIQSDFVLLLEAMAKKEVDTYELVEDPRHACCVILASKGYPGNYPKGLPITIANRRPDDIIFHAGTAFDKDEQLITAGGRVIAAVAYGSTAQKAREAAYELENRIHFDGKTIRKDIGIIRLK